MASRESGIIGYNINAMELVGKGSYGVVFTATNREGLKVAAKRIDHGSFEKLEKIKKDLDKLVQLRQANIVRMYDVHREKSTVWLFMEYEGAFFSGKKC